MIPADYVGMVSANDEPDKLEKSGFHAVKSDKVDAPLIEELPVTLECTLMKVNETKLTRYTLIASVIIIVCPALIAAVFNELSVILN